MKKRILALLLCGIFLTGCGQVMNQPVSEAKSETKVEEKPGRVEIAQTQDTKLYDDDMITVLFREPQGVFVIINKSDDNLLLQENKRLLNGHKIDDSSLPGLLDAKETKSFSPSLTDLKEAKEIIEYSEKDLNPEDYDETRFIEEGMNNIYLDFNYETETVNKNVAISIDLEDIIVRKWVD